MSGSRRSALPLWLVALAMTAAFVALITSQHRELAVLRGELEAQARGSPESEFQKPDTAPSESPVPPPSGIEADASEAAAWRRLADEIAHLRDRIVARERALRDHLASRTPASQARLPMTQTNVRFTDWTNAGRDTPEAAIETMLWAAAGGELGALEELLDFGDDAADAARALFDRLPADLRTECERPERLVALLTAGDVPLTSARLVTLSADVTPDQRFVIVQLSRPNAPPRLVQLQTMSEGETAANGTWRIIVPRGAIEAYTARLTGTAPAH